MKTLRSALLITIILFNFIFTGCGKKEDDVTTQKDTKSNTQNQTQQQTPPQTQTNTNIPKIGMIWTQIEKKSEALGQEIQSGKAHHLDEPIAEVINLLKTLPAKSAGLGQAKLDLIKNKINELEKMGSNIDELHHDKKDSEVIKEYEKFTQSLYEIKSQYPPESFK